MRVGDKLYKVNRDDRHSTIEKHRFIVLELSGHLKVENVELMFFGTLHNLTITPSSILANMRQNNNKVIQFSARRGELGDGAIVVMAKSLESAAEAISSETRNVYVQKEDARDEIKRLLEGELIEMKRREESLKESIEKLTESLNEL